METRIINYLNSRTLNPLKISKKAGVTIGDVIPVSEAKAIIMMIMDDSLKNYLDKYDRIALESELSQKICFKCNLPMIKQAKYSFKKPTEQMLSRSLTKATAWSWECQKCGNQSKIFETNCLQ